MRHEKGKLLPKTGCRRHGAVQAGFLGTVGFSSLSIWAQAIGTSSSVFRMQTNAAKRVDQGRPDWFN